MWQWFRSISLRSFLLGVGSLGAGLVSVLLGLVSGERVRVVYGVACLVVFVGWLMYGAYRHYVRHDLDVDVLRTMVTGLSRDVADMRKRASRSRAWRDTEGVSRYGVELMFALCRRGYGQPHAVMSYPEAVAAARWAEEHDLTGLLWMAGSAPGRTWPDGDVVADTYRQLHDAYTKLTSAQWEAVLVFLGDGMSIPDAITAGRVLG